MEVLALVKTATPTNNTQNSSSKRITNTRQKSLQNANSKFAFVWLDPNVNDSDVIYRNSIRRLQHIAVSINTFTDVNSCVQFGIKMKDVKILMIIVEDLLKKIWFHIQSMTHIHSVYILSSNGQSKEYPKQE